MIWYIYFDFQRSGQVVIHIEQWIGLGNWAVVRMGKLGGLGGGWLGEDDSELSFPERCDYGPLPPDPPTYKTNGMNPKTKPTTSSKQGTQHPTRPTTNRDTYQRTRAHRLDIVGD